MRYDTNTNTFVFNKGELASISPHFSTEEFQCQCSFDDCIVQQVSKLLIDRLETVRNAYNMPISIASGFRCHKHQLELAASGKETAVGLSQHELGKAADIKGSDMVQLEDLAHQNFNAVGIAKSFIHVDTRDDKVRSWTYVKE